MKAFILPTALAVLMLAGCGPDRTQLVDVTTDNEIVAGLDYKDFETAASEATNAILGSAKVRNATPAGKTYVVAIGRVADETPLHINTDLLTARISESLLNDERFVLSAVFAETESNRDNLVADVRTIRDNDEFDASTIQGKGQLQAADFSLTGAIIARDVRRDNGGHQYEYYFQLRMNDLKTGTTLMVKETKVIKRTGEASHT